MADRQMVLLRKLMPALVLFGVLGLAACTGGLGLNNHGLTVEKGMPSGR